jgi:hypothetical protein
MRISASSVVVGLLVLAACGGEPVAVPPVPTTPAPTPIESPATPEPTASATRSPEIELPAGLPDSFAEDLDPASLPPQALVPGRADVIGVWFAPTAAGEAVLIAWADPKGDPFRRDGGIAVWRRFEDAPPWRAIFGRATPAEEGVLGVRATTADMTGDGSEDALVVSDTGGTGACGRYLVLDLLTAGVAWERALCDAQVDPSSAPVGLVIEQAVFEAGDAHCCPSAFRRTVLTYEGDGRWTKASVEERPT